MATQMSEKQYAKFRGLIYDFGGFKPDVVVYAKAGPEYGQRLKMAQSLKAFEQKYGSAHRWLVLPENMDDWSHYNEILKTNYHI